MKLLVVSQYFRPEPFRINDICDGLVARGHDITVLTSVPNVPQGKFYDGYGWFKHGEKEYNGIKIHRVDVFERRTGSGFRLALNCASFAFNSLFYIPRLMKEDFDAVFVFNNSPVSKLVPANIIARKKKIPNIVFILDIWPESMFFLLGMKDDPKITFFKRISYAVSKMLYKGASAILISSTGFEKKLRNMGLTCPIEFFPNYAEKLKETDFTVSREQLGIDDGDFVIGFSGNIGKAQGLDSLIDVTEKAEKNLKWLIVGDGPELENIKNRVSDCGLDDNFVFTGWVPSENVSAYLNICDSALVSLKNSEVLNLTVPAKLQTYMAAGKPILAFMNGAGADIVNSSGCGISAEAENNDALGNAIDEMRLLSKERLMEMGNRAKSYCAENYERERLLDFLQDFIAKQIDEREGKKN